MPVPAVRTVMIVAVVAAAVAACGNGPASVRSVAPAPAPTATSSTATSSTATSLTATSSTTTTAVRSIDEVGDTGGATKVITVVSSSWSASTATLTLWQRGSDGSWAAAGGPWQAGVGRAGWAYQPGESTLRSPVGSFGFGTGFGLRPDPGYAGGWFDIGDTDYWVEDPASPDYNTHQQGPVDPAQARWGHFEHLVDYPVAYRYVALIDFNVPARGGIGSGIFLHESTGKPTAGCVSLPEAQLLTALRWIDPATTRIIMGPASELPKL
ncbi:MAG TPA: L,D-transpeptidase family protein [Acidimicrobiales bacterium]|nr:L,D-transpeptidase family protein [Acidimicrobiales bacterium]